MAIDTANRRASVIGLALAFRLIMPTPDGAVSAPDREQLAYCYCGLTAPVTPSGNVVVASDLSNLFLKQTYGAPSVVVGPTLADLRSRQKSERRQRQDAAREARAQADAESAQFMALQAAQLTAKRHRDMTALLAAWMDDE